MSKSSIYYPKYKLNPTEAQNQPYPSPLYYPYPEPKNTYCLNPSTLKSLKTLDVDDLQGVFGKGLQNTKTSTISTKLENERIFSEDPEINDIKSSIERARLNKMLAKQMQQNQIKRLQNLINDTKMDEKVLKEIELERQKEKEKEEKRKKEMLKTKYLIQQQMLDKEKIKQESIKEYEKDRRDVDNMINNIIKEDLLAKEEFNRKRHIAKSYMEEAYARKEFEKKKNKEEEMLMKEKERQYQEDMQKREDDRNNQRAQKQFEKDKIFNKLCEQEAQRKAEEDYWENIRNELHLEQENKKIKMAEKAEKDKKLRQKEEMIESAMKQKKIKDDNKKKEIEMEEEFKKRYIEKLKEEEETEKLNAQKKKQKELELKMDVEKQWQYKLKQYQLQKEEELKNLEQFKIKEQAKKYLIEKEKQRLLKENEDLLKGYYPFGYQKGINSLKNISNPSNNEIKHGIIINNIFGNSNPNKSSVYPKYGNIKNFVYDKSIQDVHNKINMKNYLMYNATANNNYDSYPTPEEYIKMMEKVGQKHLAYAGNTDTTGIPMRGQMPILGNNKKLTKSISCAGIQNPNYSKYSTIDRSRPLIKSTSTVFDTTTNDNVPKISNMKYKIDTTDNVGINNNNFRTINPQAISEPL